MFRVCMHTVGVKPAFAQRQDVEIFVAVRQSFAYIGFCTVSRAAAQYIERS